MLLTVQHFIPASQETESIVLVIFTSVIMWANIFAMFFFSSLLQMPYAFLLARYPSCFKRSELKKKTWQIYSRFGKLRNDFIFRIFVFFDISFEHLSIMTTLFIVYNGACVLSARLLIFSALVLMLIWMQSESRNYIRILG